MSIEEIKTDLTKRLEMAKASYKTTNPRQKESAWGKMVAYSHCLKLINRL